MAADEKPLLGVELMTMHALGERDGTTDLYHCANCPAILPLAELITANDCNWRGLDTPVENPVKVDHSEITVTDEARAWYRRRTKEQRRERGM